MNVLQFDNFTIGANIKKKILIVGMNNIGFNIAKNLIISNILNITFRDKTSFSKEDLNSVVEKKFININKADGYKKIIESLHNNANINILNTDILTEDDVFKYDVIVITEYYSNEIVSINNIARKRNIKLLLIETFGLYGYIYADYGDVYISENINGRIEKSGKIIKIFESTIETEYPQDFKINDRLYIKIDDHDGEIVCSAKIIDIGNDNKTFTLKNLDRISKKHKIDLTKSKNLYFVELKNNIEYNHCDFLNSVTTPQFSNENNIENQELLHWFTFSVKTFANKYKKIPETTDEIDKLNKIFSVVRNDMHIEKLNYKKLLKYINTNIHVIDNFFVGIISYEILKIINNIGTPINQWLDVDFSNIYNNDPEEDMYYNVQQLNNFGIENINNLITTTNKIIFSDNQKVNLDDMQNFMLFNTDDFGDLKSDIIKKKILNNKYEKNKNISKSKLINITDTFCTEFEKNICVNYNSTSGIINFKMKNMNAIEYDNIFKIKNISVENVIDWSKKIMAYFFNEIPLNFMAWKNNSLNRIKFNEYEFIIKNYSRTPYEIVEFSYKFWKFIFKTHELDDDDVYLITIISNIWCTVCCHSTLTIGLVNQILDKLDKTKLEQSTEILFDISNDMYFTQNNKFNESIISFNHNNLSNLEIYFGFIKYSTKIKLRKYKIIIDDKYIKKIDIMYSSYIISSVMSSLAILSSHKYVNTDKKIEINLMENTNTICFV